MPNDPWTLTRLERLDDRCIEQLTGVLLDCVDGGASVGFMAPLPRDRARSFWQRIAADVAAGRRAIVVATDAAGICGTVQLVLDQPDNGAHRADVAKMLVHRRARRRGLGEALLRAIEDVARSCGKRVLVLDTVTGSDASRLYERLGWTRVGDIPNYALFPNGSFCSTTYFHRDLG